mgnify:CR=1 FL=1
MKTNGCRYLTQNYRWADQYKEACPCSSQMYSCISSPMKTNRCHKPMHQNCFSKVRDQDGDMYLFSDLPKRTTRSVQRNRHIPGMPITGPMYLYSDEETAAQGLTEKKCRKGYVRLVSPSTGKVRCIPHQFINGEYALNDFEELGVIAATVVQVPARSRPFSRKAMTVEVPSRTAMEIRCKRELKALPDSFFVGPSQKIFSLH